MSRMLISISIHLGCRAKICRASTSASPKAVFGKSTENASAKSAWPYEELSREAGGKSACSIFGYLRMLDR